MTGVSAKEYKLKEEKRKLESLVTNLQRNNSHLQKEVKKYKRRSKSGHDLKNAGHGHSKTSLPRMASNSSTKSKKRNSLKILQDFVSESKSNEANNEEKEDDDTVKTGSQVVKIRSPRHSNVEPDDEKPPHKRGISITSDQADDIKVGDVTSSFTITFARLLNQDDGTYYLLIHFVFCFYSVYLSVED